MRKPLAVSILLASVELASGQARESGDKEAVPAAKTSTSIHLGLGASVEGGTAWKPLTGAERWALYRKTTLTNPMRYGRALVWTLRDQAAERPEGWDFGRRLGSRLARSGINTSLEHSLSALAGYETRYVRCACKGAWKRVGHALAYEFVTLDRGGKRVFNWPHFAGVYASEFAAASWTPGVKWSAGGVQSAHEQIVGSALFNLVREFLPDLKKKRKRQAN